MKTVVAFLCVTLFVSSEAFFGLGDGWNTIAMMNTLNNRPFLDMGGMFGGGQPMFAVRPTYMPQVVPTAQPTVPAARMPARVQYPSNRGGFFGGSGGGLGQLMGYSMIFDGPF